MDFIQPAPILGNQYRDDSVLRSYMARALPRSLCAAIENDLDELGAHAARAWAESRKSTPVTPTLTQWDAWGERIDRIEATPVWQRGAALTARYGLVACGHETTYGEHARTNQFLRVYMHHVASEFYTCPLAMTDGAATALKASGNRGLIERAVPRLLSRDPATSWLSGQWMTETIGGSDVANTETIARHGADGRWRLHGRKWFTSAVIGEMALTLARPEGSHAETGALALFYLETHGTDGRWNGIRIDRLKDKLGTRELPTAELHMDGTLAEPVGELINGVRLIAPMLNVTRTWNAVCALATMRRCIALAFDYARRRQVFGRPLIEQPLHRATLASMQAEFEAAFQLVLFVTELLGRVEVGNASAGEKSLLRVLTPLAKLWTGKLAVRIASETCEAFGGAGYIENTGIPQLLRDAQVYPIWEGTTNVLALDVLRALGTSGIDGVISAADGLLDQVGSDPHGVRSALLAAHDWLIAHSTQREALETGARRFALTLARGFAAALLARHAKWMECEHSDASGTAALAIFASHGIARLDASGLDAIALLTATSRN